MTVGVLLWRLCDPASKPCIAAGRTVVRVVENEWQGNKDSNLGMLESKSSALTSLAIPLRNLLACRLVSRCASTVRTGRNLYCRSALLAAFDHWVLRQSCCFP